MIKGKNLDIHRVYKRKLENKEYGSTFRKKYLQINNKEKINLRQTAGSQKAMNTSS